MRCRWSRIWSSSTTRRTDAPALRRRNGGSGRRFFCPPPRANAEKSEKGGESHTPVTPGGLTKPYRGVRAAGVSSRMFTGIGRGASAATGGVGSSVAAMRQARRGGGDLVKPRPCTCRASARKAPRIAPGGAFLSHACVTRPAHEAGERIRPRFAVGGSPCRSDSFRLSLYAVAPRGARSLNCPRLRPGAPFTRSRGSSRSRDRRGCLPSRSRARGRRASGLRAGFRARRGRGGHSRGRSACQRRRSIRPR